MFANFGIDCVVSLLSKKIHPSMPLQRCWAQENVPPAHVDIWDDDFAELNTSFTVVFFCLRTPSSSCCELVEKPNFFYQQFKTLP